MNLEEFTNAELKTLLTLIEDQMKISEKMKKVSSLREFQEWENKKIRELQLLSVKINNQLGDYD
ncbi:hypothetical protein [Bacillus sp. UMB0728]|uniref:hypothetical protein n=1 Tax=Bacillus sp. UMB0728 TaxID=2066052 RepID=UPI000C7920CD|nr:hypothetical protein [Bacillus sp. UMB0728]PLR72230.1 hypothetical protein CYJ37_11790 [Bacillus sp. UMB0728]